MKKLVLTSMLMFILMSFNFTKKDNIILEDGRECVNIAMQWVYDAAEVTGDGDLNGQYYDEYMAVYKFYYQECMNGNL